MNRVFDCHVNATLARLCNSKPLEPFTSTFTRDALLAMRKSLSSLLNALSDRDALVSEARNNGLSSVRTKYKLNATFMDDLLELSMMEYDARNYLLACELLKAFRLLASVDSITVSFDKQLSALWGSLCCNLILEEWDSSCQLALSLNNSLESLMIGRYRKSIGYHMAALVNWMPVLLFLAPSMNKQLLSLFLSEHCISVILTTESHLKPFVAAAILASTDLDLGRARAIVSDLAGLDDPLIRVASAIFFNASPEKLISEIGRAKSVTGVLARFAAQDLEKCAFSKLFRVMEKSQMSISPDYMQKYFSGNEPGNFKTVTGWCQAASEAVVESLM